VAVAEDNREKEESMAQTVSEITVSLIDNALNEGYAPEEAIDLTQVPNPLIDDLYCKELIAFRQYVQAHQDSISPEIVDEPEERFNNLWQFLELLRLDIDARPRLTTQQALRTLDLEQGSTETEIRSRWLEEIFGICEYYLLVYNSHPLDYEALTEDQEAMLRLNFIDAAYQRLIEIKPEDNL
jgi:hypothetical protein